MSTLKSLRAAVLLVYMLSTFAISQNETVVIRDEVATFVLRDGGTVWDIWEQYGSVLWTTFYDATAPLNPVYAVDRFRSVPIGAPIEVPISVLRTDFVNSLLVEELVAEPSFVTEFPALSERVEDLRTVFTSQRASIQDIGARLETLSSAVETLQARTGTLGAMLVAENTPVVVEPPRLFGLTQEQWAGVLRFVIAIVLFLILILLVLILSTLRSQKRHNETVHILRDDRSHPPVVVPTINNEENEKLNTELEELNAREGRFALEMDMLENHILSAHGYKAREGSSAQNSRGRAKSRGTHGRGRKFT